MKKSILIFVILVCELFWIGYKMQSWNPETVCIQQSGGVEYCKTETVDFWSTSMEEFATFGNGMGDITNYIWIAQYFLGDRPASDRIMAASFNWPPGFPFIISVVMKVTGGGEAYFPKMLAATSLFLAFVCCFAAISLFQKVGWGILLVPPLVFFLTPDIAYYTLGRGYALSEAWAAGSILLLFAQIRMAAANPSVLRFIVIGMISAFCSYLRAMFEPMMVISYLGTLLGLFLYLRFFSEKIENFKGLRDILFSCRSKWILLAAVALGTHLAFVHPWKIRNQGLTGLYTLCATADAVFDLHWTDTSKMPGWLPNLNVGCRLYPDLCKKMQMQSDFYGHRKTMTKVAIILNPFGWIRNKSVDLDLFWPGMSRFDQRFSVWDVVSLRFFQDSRLRSFFEGLLFFVFLCFSVVISLGQLVARIRNKESGRSLVAPLFFLMFFGAHCVVFMVAGFEVRYSMYLRIASLFVCIEMMRLLLNRFVSSANFHNKLKGRKLSL